MTRNNSFGKSLLKPSEASNYAYLLLKYTLDFRGYASKRYTYKKCSLAKTENTNL